jgi:integrase
MRAALAALARLLRSPDIHACPWHLLTYAHTAALRAQLAASLAPATANKILAALRGVLTECRRLGLMGADACAAARDIAPVKGRRLPAGRALEAAEISALLRACNADASPRGRRDAAIIAVGYAAGLRRAEIVGLSLADYEPATRALTVRRGKGNAARVAYFGADWAGLIDAWVAARGRRGAALFVGVSRTGRIIPRGLAASTVRQICLARGAEAGIARFSPHDLRRSFISDLLDADVDALAVQACAGHANLATTGRYDRRGERAKRAAVERLRMPA